MQLDGVDTGGRDLRQRRWYRRSVEIVRHEAKMGTAADSPVIVFRQAGAHNATATLGHERKAIGFLGPSADIAITVESDDRAGYRRASDQLLLSGQQAMQFGPQYCEFAVPAAVARTLSLSLSSSSCGVGPSGDRTWIRVSAGRLRGGSNGNDLPADLRDKIIILMLRYVELG